jgi:hypothetical protein
MAGRVLDSYADLVRKYPSVFSSIEEAARSLTLLMPDRFGSAELQIEALYASLNLLGLYHSKILMKPPTNASHMLYVSPPQHDNLSAKIRMFKMATHANTILVVIGNVQVLLEMLARKANYRWPVILTVELLKCLCRTMILKNNAPETTILRVANASELNREILEGRLLSSSQKSAPVVEESRMETKEDNNNQVLDNNKQSRRSRNGFSNNNDFSELVELYKISGRGSNRHGNFTSIYKPNNNEEQISSSENQDLTLEVVETRSNSLWSIDGLMEFAHILRPVVYGKSNSLSIFILIICS